MKDILKYVMGEAAKSNVEKRRVGCVITAVDVKTGKEIVVGSGHNSSAYPEHAEVRALLNLQQNLPYKVSDLMVTHKAKAYVTHQPCPDCAQKLLAAGVHDIEIVEAFMKFDGDKLRFDLVAPEFICKYLGPQDFIWGAEYNANKVKEELYLYAIDDQPAVVTKLVLSSYTDLSLAEVDLAKVLTFGARKYKPNNWRKCSDTGRYLAAAHRHNNAILAGEVKDQETGFEHRAHVLTNLMFLDVLGLTYGEDKDE